MSWVNRYIKSREKHAPNACCSNWLYRWTINNVTKKTLYFASIDLLKINNQQTYSKELATWQWIVSNQRIGERLTRAVPSAIVYSNTRWWLLPLAFKDTLDNTSCLKILKWCCRATHGWTVWPIQFLKRRHFNRVGKEEITNQLHGNRK